MSTNSCPHLAFNLGFLIGIYALNIVLTMVCYN